MGSTDYEFWTVWRVAGTPEEVAAVLGEATAMPRWWPSVYLSAETVAGGPEPGPGLPRPARLHTKGWLPYTLRWTLTVTEPVTPRGFALTAAGDLNGTGRWTFEPDGPETVITYRWRVNAAKPRSPAELAAQTRVRGQPPLGDGARPGEPRPGAPPAPGRGGDHHERSCSAAATAHIYLADPARNPHSRSPQGLTTEGLASGLLHNRTETPHSLDH